MPILFSMSLLWLLTLYFLISPFSSIASSAPQGSFSFVTALGKDAAANSAPVGIALSHDEKFAYVVGNTSPKHRTGASQFGEPTGPQLRDADFFIAKIDLLAQSEVWAFRHGTLKEDRAEALLLESSGKHMYVAGSTFGAFLGGPGNRGLSDAFIAKYELRTNETVATWRTPLMLGTTGTESVTHLVESPDDADLLFAIGYTTGKLFSPNAGGVTDAFLISFSARDGAIRNRVQFGGKTAEQGVLLVIAPGVGAPLFAAVETERRIGKVTVSNFHLYKFSKTLQKRGDVLLTSFATEHTTGMQVHPGMEGTVLVAGVSKLDQTNLEDVFVKRISVNTTSDADIGSSIFNVEEVPRPDYTKRIGAGAHDYASCAAVHHQTGSWIVAGFSTGKLPGNQSCSCKADMAPFFARIDPLNGGLLNVAQFGDLPVGAWANVKNMAVSKDGKKIVFTGKAMNKTTSLFYVNVGIFAVPEGWQQRIKLEKPAVARATPNATIEGKPFPVIAVAAGAGGGALVILFCSILVYCIVRGQKGA